MLMLQIISWQQSSCRINSQTAIAFCLQKLNTAQKQYTTAKRNREMLSAIALILKELAKVNNTGLRDKGLSQPHYSIQHIEGYDLL
jgi:hypothetical protein